MEGAGTNSRQGDNGQQGISQRAVIDLFREVKKAHGEKKHINVFCSFLQIYNERVYDLLNPESNPMEQREDEGDGFKNS
jgi:hypothetical protein